MGLCRSRSVLLLFFIINLVRDVGLWQASLIFDVTMLFLLSGLFVY